MEDVSYPDIRAKYLNAMLCCDVKEKNRATTGIEYEVQTNGKDLGQLLVKRISKF